MKFTATMFCAAAVFMPTFHTLSTCATVIISMPAKRLFSGTPKALIMPITMGTRQATRAVVLGTKKLKIKPHKITPSKTRFALAPTLESIIRAIRLSSPVLVMAAARNIAAATRQKAVDENPFSAIPSPALVPYNLPVASLGANPTRRAIKTIITPALTGYEIAVVAQTITENTITPIILCPATDRPSGVGRSTITARTASAI